MKHLTVKFHFTSGLHAGEPGIGVENFSETLHSDTLFSAISNVWRALYGRNELEGLLNEFLHNQPPFLISSGFLFYKDRYFLPRPFLPPPKGSFMEGRLREEMRSIRFVNTVLFSKWIKAQEFQEKDFKELEKDRQLYEDSFREHVRPAVVIDRETSQSSIFYRGEIVFNEGAGLYCLLSCSDEILDKLKAVFLHLQDTGLGGERSQGLGAFRAEFIDGWVVDEAETEEHCYCVLSLFNPSESDALLFNAETLYGYEIVQRGGWASSVDFPAAKRLLSTRFIKEGAIINGFEPVGRLVNVNPDGNHPHPVYKNGLAFRIRVNRNALKVNI